MEDAIVAAIRRAVDDGEKEVLTRTIAAVLRASDYGHNAEENLCLLISAAIRNMTPDGAEELRPETIAGAILNGLFLGRPAEFRGGKIAVSTQNNGEDMIALVTRGDLPDE